MTQLKNSFSGNAQLRHQLYHGDLFLLDSEASSQYLVDEIKDLLIDSFGEDFRHERHSSDAALFFEKISFLRKEIYLNERFHKILSQLIAEVGFDCSKVSFDPARLRVISHKGHDNPKAAPVYYAHRDTWYSHSQSLISWWVPLNDLDEEETFVFYPDYFSKQVPNNSEIFNYDHWVKDGWDLKIGWQNKNDGIKAQYPNLTGNFNDSNEIGFSCKEAQNLLFAGAHFHKTLKQELHKTRFSLDFRIVHLDDHQQGTGAPNADNRSQGSTIKDYFSCV